MLRLIAVLHKGKVPEALRPILLKLPFKNEAVPHQVRLEEKRGILVHAQGADVVVLDIVDRVLMRLVCGNLKGLGIKHDETSGGPRGYGVSSLLATGF